ncbi:hypothetical protein CRYUN_Cryun09bG0056700 [Craigia yunnanensis]
MEIFSKTLSKTDVNKRCAVPMKCFKNKRFPKLEGNDKVHFEVKDESGHAQTLCCSKRKIGNDPKHPKHPKPALTKGWIPFVCQKKLRVGDRVIIYEEQDETGLMQLRIKVEKQSSPYDASWSPVMNQNLERNKGSTTNNSDKEPDLGVTNAATSSSIEKEQIPIPHGTSQDVACYKTERPNLSLSLELTLKPTMTAGITAATSSSIDKEQTPFPHSSSHDITCYRTERSSLSLSSGLTLKPTMSGGQQHAYMQETEPKTIDFLGSFL